MKKILSIGLLALVVTSCQYESKRNETTITPTPFGVPSASKKEPMGQNPINNPAHGQPFHDCTLPVGAPLKTKNSPEQTKGLPAPVNFQQQATTSMSQSNVNPAHGSPGHRCDIAVGAPLS